MAIRPRRPQRAGEPRSATDSLERPFGQVFLCTGFREKEVATLGWSDIHWKEGKLAVSAKPDLGFTPKS